MLKKLKRAVEFSFVAGLLAMSQVALAQDIEDCSAENVTTIQQVYVSYYARPAEPGGLLFWCGQLQNSGGDIAGIITEFGISAEFTNRYEGLSDNVLLESLYQQILGRSPDDAGRAFWVGELSSGARDLQNVAIALLGGATGDDAVVINSRVQLAEDFTRQFIAFTAQMDDARKEALVKATFTGTSAIAGLLQDILKPSGGNAADITAAFDRVSEIAVYLTTDTSGNGITDFFDEAADPDQDGEINAADRFPFDVANLLKFSAGDAVTVAVEEGGTAVSYSPRVNADADKVIYRISGGLDRSDFRIDTTTGVITFREEIDFEAPLDSGRDNNYVVEITAQVPSVQNATAVQSITVDVVDVGPTPRFNSAAAVSVLENTEQAVYVASVDVDLDNESPLQFVVYGLLTDTGAAVDNDLFAIDIDGNLRFISPPDFEAPASTNNSNNYIVELFALTIGADLTVYTVSKTLTVSVQNIESVVFTGQNSASVVVTDTDALNAVLLSAQAVNEGSGVLSYAKTGGADESLFSLNSNSGELSFVAGALADVAAGSSYTVTVEALIDAQLSGIDQQFTVNVTGFVPPIVDPNAPFALDSETRVLIDEDSPFIHSVTSNKSGVVYSISGGDDQAFFSINATTGEMSRNGASFSFASPEDFDQDNSYQVTITAVFGDESIVQSHQFVVVTNSQQFAPELYGGNRVELSVLENKASTDYTVFASDANGDLLSYELIGTTDDDLFELDANNVLTFKVAPDFENPKATAGGNVYSVFVRVSDGSADDSQEIVVTIGNAPGFVLADAHIVEPASGNTSMLVFNITIDEGVAPPGGAGVFFTTDSGSASAGSDFQSVQGNEGTVVILAGEKSTVATVIVNADQLSESDETLTITLFDPISNIELGTDVEATGTIYDIAKLNDTGITLCADYAYGSGSGSHSNKIACNGSDDEQGDPIPDGQDAFYGRDSTLYNDDDGHAGFSFTKVDSSGSPLPADAAVWSCVQDNTTGLIWEVKTKDGGLRDSDNVYSWFNSSGINTGGDNGFSTSFGCPDGNCSTEKFTTAVNAAQLCGAGDWRLPTVNELTSLLNYSRVAPTVDREYFPNTESAQYWSADTSVSDVESAWQVYFSFGYNRTDLKENRSRVRLVRAGQ